ncbi:hypothetical protein MKW98_014374 [Papaver atlanticum]|uniref:AP2/ERF domain-containing protein n=1 Tax=Papaver atlanticum TaxID=357466 RepID=A0AAD4SR38_9MAGN|nr:hypothetical protein MKW98_014374 [Papaver atlanticum]
MKTSKPLMRFPGNSSPASSSSGRKPFKVVRFSLTDSNTTGSSSSSDNDNHRRVQRYNYKNEIYGEEQTTTTSTIGIRRKRKFNTAKEAAMAYDREAIRLRGSNAFTNFDCYTQQESEPLVVAAQCPPPRGSTAFARYGGDCDSQIQISGKKPLVRASDVQLLMHFVNAIKEQVPI